MQNFKSGTYINQGYYRSFSPSLINRNWKIDDMEVITLLSKADRMLGRLDMYSEHIPNIELFIAMHIMKEATQSSKIEGTQTRMEDALMNEEDVPLGESIKGIDKLTNKEFLPQYSEVDWKGAMGIRDIIAHHYFELHVRRY